MDYGRRRVGVAGSSSGLNLVFGITTLTITGMADLLRQLEPILQERAVKEIILGFPLTLGNKPGTLTSEVLSLAQALIDRGLVVHLVDEALSSKLAEGVLRQRPGRSRKEDRDRAAAAWLLQEYLAGTLPPLSAAEIKNLIVKDPPKE